MRTNSTVKITVTETDRQRLLALLTGTTPKEEKAVTTTRKTTRKSAPKSTKKGRAPIKCAECGVTVTNPTWNQKFCAKHSAERQVAFGNWLAETAEDRKARHEGNVEAQAWIDEKVEEGKITKPETPEARAALWAEVKGGSRNIKHLDKVVRDNLVTDLVPEAPAKTVRKSTKALEAEIEAKDAKVEALIKALVALGIDEEDAIETALAIKA